MDDPALLLSIEDSAADAQLLQETLRASGCEPRFELAACLEEGLAALEMEEPDLVLLDLSLPDADGLQGLHRVQEMAPSVPVVVVSGHADDDIAREAVRQGAQDYLSKDQLDTRVLLRSIEHARERKRLITQLDESHREELRRKDLFLSHVSHEFRTPLSAIQQFTSILVDGLAGPLTADQLDYLQVVLRNVGELKRMVEDLLEATRASAGRLCVQTSSLDLSSVIREVVHCAEARAKENDIRLHCQVSETRPVLGDPTRVRQVLSNLLDNALKFTPAGGSVSVSAAPAAEDTGCTLITVTDTGPGIPADERDAVFEPMFQSVGASADMCRKGLGLGLHICRELMAMQGGRIWVEDSTGPGSTFVLELPVYSLPSLLEPLCEYELESSDSVHLVDLSLWQGGRRPRPARGASQLAALRRVVDRCTTVDRDVILPTEDGVRFVSRCRAPHPDVVLRRIDEQVQRDAMLGNARYVLSMEVRPLHTPGAVIAQHELAASLAASLQVLIDSSEPPLVRTPEESLL
ncbi:MAG: hypothetical protein DHS20C15_26420 [Planctomycetota bacterium]|nr:MAG: hypothetical protein DHS20C15_26420 [Planctomycetota bacterium]